MPTANQQRVTQVRTAGATRVAEKIKHLSTFIYLLGGVNSGIAAVDEAVPAETRPHRPSCNRTRRAKRRSGRVFRIFA